MPTKLQLLENVQRDDMFEHQQLYKQFKMTSPATAYLNATRPYHTKKEQLSPSLRLDDGVPSTSITLPSLSTLIIKHIVTFLVFDRAWDSKWIVALSTVSSQFHQAVSSVLSNNVIPTLSIRSMITHLGSSSSMAKHCLFKSPPLHLNAIDLEHIPSEHLETCLDRLESLLVPISLLTYERIVLIKVRAPNVRHIKFEDQNHRTNEYMFSRCSKWTRFSPHVSMSHVKRDRQGHCYDQFFTQLFEFYLNDEGANSIQSIEIVLRSPVGPPSPPHHFKGHFNFTLDMEAATNRLSTSEWHYDHNNYHEDEDEYEDDEDEDEEDDDEYQDEDEDDKIDLSEYFEDNTPNNLQLVSTLIVGQHSRFNKCPITEFINVRELEWPLCRFNARGKESRAELHQSFFNEDQSPASQHLRTLVLNVKTITCCIPMLPKIQTSIQSLNIYPRSGRTVQTINHR
ncbi:hypothetical protein SAMD00019534_097230 [Acytostelium subglobosum LB1]|uniref:hypothetical protein n=1 Tax=Acytostelium subglobosum LB1 TaxID=1410327 RepID=UPI0006448689|nr:hypothetical protein SAMD00019534_097230 [Acytostelium subglobosum LB1]GAM26548.1 hypothetical protein SAMD00019534_097230 [Acytostelium subglobosum LB1]|eukprot:XP_012750644.1 hypothetical protein SAMD00019534_097230 [Acytostelium subglobosum LB1]